MTPKQRILSVYSGQRPDRVPIGIYSRYHRLGDAERAARNRGLGLLAFSPAVSLLAPPWHIKPGYVSEVRGVTLRIDMTWEDGAPVERRTFETPVGTVWQETTIDPTYGSDWIRKHYIAAPEDYKIMRYVAERTVLAPRHDAIARLMNDLGEDGVVLARIDRSPYQKLLVELAGPERFLTDLMTDPGPAEELMAVYDARMDEQVRLACEGPAEAIWSPDNVTADLTPPTLFEQYQLPFYRKHGETIRAADKRYVVHMDGRLAGIKDLIARSPFDVVESFSFAETAGDVPVPEALAAWPDKTLCPNVPAPLCDKPAEEIERFLDGVWDSFGKAPFMLQLSEDFPLDAYRHILDILCRYTERGLPR